jgi:uncharacterized membrane protein (UPF0182 family)
MRLRRSLPFLIALAVGLFLTGRIALSYWVDLLWFRSLGFGNVFWKSMGLQVAVFIGVEIVNPGIPNCHSAKLHSSASSISRCAHRYCSIPTRQSFKLYSWKRVPGSSAAEIAATAGVDSGLLPAAVGVAVSKIASIASKAALILSGVGITTEAAFLLSCAIP